MVDNTDLILAHARREERWEDQMHANNSIEALAVEFEERLLGKEASIRLQEKMAADVIHEAALAYFGRKHPFLLRYEEGFKVVKFAKNGEPAVALISFKVKDRTITVPISFDGRGLACNDVAYEVNPPNTGWSDNFYDINTWYYGSPVI